jgi:hypothetical protein
MIDELDSLLAKSKKVKKDPFEGHRDFRKELLEVIDELEKEQNLSFKKEEVFERTDSRKIPREEAEVEFDDLIASGIIRELKGGDGIYQRANRGDYSPAFEDMPDW